MVKFGMVDLVCLEVATLNPHEPNGGYIRFWVGNIQTDMVMIEFRWYYKFETCTLQSHRLEAVIDSSYGSLTGLSFSHFPSWRIDPSGRTSLPYPCALPFSQSPL